MLDKFSRWQIGSPAVSESNYFLVIIMNSWVLNVFKELPFIATTVLFETQIVPSLDSRS